MSKAKAHRALQWPEIVEPIFEELEDDRASLACSARTCRLFSRLALAILWRHFNRPQALREIIPRDSATTVSHSPAHLFLITDVYIAARKPCSQMESIRHVCTTRA